jgi:meso-butanediol dehydrogenase/(S,S)-butanediol dehydrogenase/diacetyl reductase
MSNRYDISEQVVVVTGAGSGIGRAIARAFLDNGALVALVGRRQEALEGTAEGFAADRSLIVPLDLTETGAPARLAEIVVERFGRVDVLVSNAGVHVGGDIADLTDDDWRTLRATNIEALLFTVRALLPQLEESKGNVVAVSSVSGLRGDWGQAGYNATKGAVNALVQSLALDFGDRGVRVNAVAPAFTKTDMTDSMGVSGAALDAFVNRIALGRPGEPEDIAPAVLFLASPDARYITGAILPVDGGTSASTGQAHV